MKRYFAVAMYSRAVARPKLKSVILVNLYVIMFVSALSKIGSKGVTVCRKHSFGTACSSWELSWTTRMHLFQGDYESEARLSLYFLFSRNCCSR